MRFKVSETYAQGEIDMLRKISEYAQTNGQLYSFDDDLIYRDLKIGYRELVVKAEALVRLLETHESLRLNGIEPRESKWLLNGRKGKAYL